MPNDRPRYGSAYTSVGVVMILLGLTLADSKVHTGAEGEILIPPE